MYMVQGILRTVHYVYGSGDIKNCALCIWGILRTVQYVYGGY